MERTTGWEAQGLIGNHRCRPHSGGMEGAVVAKGGEGGREEGRGASLIAAVVTTYSAQGAMRTERVL